MLECETHRFLWPCVTQQEMQCLFWRTDLFNAGFSVSNSWWVPQVIVPLYPRMITLKQLVGSASNCTIVPWHDNLETFSHPWDLTKVHTYILSCDLSLWSLQTNVTFRDSGRLHCDTALCGEWSATFLSLKTFGTPHTMVGRVAQLV